MVRLMPATCLVRSGTPPFALINPACKRAQTDIRTLSPFCTSGGAGSSTGSQPVSSRPQNVIGKFGGAQKRPVCASNLPSCASISRALAIHLTAISNSNRIPTNNAAEHAARDAIAEKPMFQSAGDLPADVLLNVAARPVEVIAVESRFRSLERQKLLYLGAKDSVCVLYDIVKMKTYLVPSGAIALQFSEVRS
jgi:hypothetical protein